MIFHKASLTDKQGSVTGLIGAILDITERKRAEEALRESEEKYRTLVEKANEAIMIAQDEVFVFANSRMSELLGVPAGKLEGKPFVDFIWPEDRDRVVANYRKRIAGETICDAYDFRIIGAGGKLTWVYLSAAAIQWKGKPATLNLVTDITERTRAEEALRESEGILQDIIEKNPMSIQIVDREGFTLRVNPAFIRLFGSVPPPDFSIITDLVKSHPELENHISRVKSGEPVNLPDMSFNPHDIYPELPDVPTRVRAIIFPLNDMHGKPQRYIFMHEDITEQKRAEEALRQANRQLTLLSGITWHDINNQLSVLQGFLAILKKKQPDLSCNESFEMAAISAQRISAMIQFTKEYEKIGVNAPAWQNCRSLVETAIKQAPLGTVKIKNDLPVGTEVFADPLVVKVFYNLMDNAVRYGGKIMTIRFSAEDAGDEHLIICEDDGDGIIVGEKEHIFERGFGKNTGLGLYLSREILSITGITIRETGEPGKGARFEMTVPKEAYRFTEKI